MVEGVIQRIQPELIFSRIHGSQYGSYISRDLFCQSAWRFLGVT